MRKFAHLNWKHFSIVFCLLAVIGAVVVRQVATGSKISEVSVPAKPDAFGLPKAVQAEYDLMSSIHASVEAEFKVRESQWQSRLATPLLAPVTQVRREALDVAKKIAELEKLPALDETAFAARPPSRIWQPASRTAVGNASQSLPPVSGVEVRVGPEEVIGAHNGELCFDAVDVVLPSRGGLGFEFRRHYRSHSDYDGPMGYGWDHNHNLRIVADSKTLSEAKMVRLHGGDFETSFSREGQRWVPQHGSFLHLETEAQGALVLTDGLRNRWSFESAASSPNGKACWRIQSAQTRHDQASENRLLYHYVAGTDVLANVEDPFGQRIRFHYDGNGRLRVVSAPSRRVEFNYGPDGSLTSATLPQVAISLSKAAPGVTDYGYYQAGGRPWCISRRINRSNHILFADIELKSNSPNFGRIVEAGYRLLASPQEKIAWILIRAGDDRQQTVTVTQPLPGPRVIYVFSKGGAFPWLPDQMSMPARKAVWNYAYNADGLCTQVEHPDGYQIRRRYDTDNANVLSHQNCLDETVVALAEKPEGYLKAKGRTTEFLPGSAYPTKVLSYQIDVAGVRTVLMEKRYEYREGSLDLWKSSVGGESTWHFWNRRGQMLAEVDGCGSVTLYFHMPGLPSNDMESFVDGSAEGGGGLVKIVEDAPFESLASLVMAEDRNRITHLPKRSSVVRPATEVTRFMYDKLGRKIGQAGPGSQMFCAVNRLGQPLVDWDASVGLTVTEYDQKLLRQRICHQFAVSSLSVPDKDYTGFSIRPFEGRFYSESYEYDAWSRVAGFSPSDEPLQGRDEKPVFRYERYPSGVLRKLIDPTGVTRVHEYDFDTGLPKKIGLEAKDGETLALQKFLRYSPSGLLMSFEDDYGDTWSKRLDSLGREFEELRPDGVISRADLDGLDRPVKETAFHETRLVDEQDREYTSSGRTAKVTRMRLRQADDGKIVSVGRMILEESRYDEGGRMVAQRGTRADAWRHFYYDGMGRVVAQKTPEADWALALYRDGNVAVASALMRRPGAEDMVALREVALLTDRFRSYAVVPVDGIGTPRWARTKVQRWSPQGHLLEALESEGLHTQTAYNTRNERVEEVARPARPGDKGETHHNIWRYNLAGRPVAQTTVVNPLALLRKEGPEKTVIPRLLPVSQTIEWHYDTLGRLVRVDQPDGVQVSRQYGHGGAMVARMTWRHASKPEAALRDIEFHYGTQRRLTALSQAGEKNPLQEFNYDVWGQCNGSADMTGHEKISVRRESDNMGLLWREQISYGHDPLQDLDAEAKPEAGTSRFRWRQPNALPSSFWTEASYQSDLDARVSGLVLDGKEFCQWGYQGQTPVSRTIPSSLTRQTLSVDPMGEVVGVAVDTRDNGKWAALSSMRYALDARGSVIASTVKLGGNAGQPESVVSQYTDLDAYRQIIGSAQEPVSWPDQFARHQQLLTVADSPASILASRIHRDQAGNVVAKYQGRWSESFLKTAQERGELFSPGPPITLPASESQQTNATSLTRMLSEADRLQLASNRLTSTAGQGREQENYKYDLLGQLSEFAGTYRDGKRLQPVFWSLRFDSLGRLIKMTAMAREPAKDKPDVHAAAIAELAFAYDSWNRRIVKRVMDHATNRVRREATLYCNDRQTVILEQHDDGSWQPMQQYVLGASPAETLQVITSPYSAGTGQSRQLERHMLHQDRSMDVVFATTVVGDRVKTTPLTAYLDTGESSSTARVSGVRSSAVADDPEACWNRRIDDGKQTHWNSQKDEWDWVELQLPEARRITGLTIWSDEFPNDFEVYAIDAGQALPSKDGVIAWRRREKDEGRLVTQPVEGGLFLSPSGLRHKLSMLECPYDLLLNGSRAERLIVLWRNSSHADRRVSVSEFSVRVLPEMASSLGQNGCWSDRETGMYYQHHRYRLPAMNGKFISPDPLGFLGGPDLYAYANNNPLQWHDPDGRFAHILWGAGIGAVFGGGSYFFECWLSGEEFSWGKLGIRTAAGALTGAVAAGTFGFAAGSLGLIGAGAVSGGAAGFIGGFSATTAEGVLLNRQSLREAAMNGLMDGAKGALAGAAAGGVGGGVGGWLGRLPGKASLLRGFGTAVATGAAGAAAGGAVGGAWTGFEEHGLSWKMLQYTVSGALRGGVYGAVIGGAAFGVGHGYDRATGRTWARGRAEYWKKNAATNSEEYSSNNVAKMQQGNPPQRVNPITEGMESMELHHQHLPQRSGLPRSVIDRQWNLKPVWPDEHKAIDPFRH